MAYQMLMGKNPIFDSKLQLTRTEVIKCYNRDITFCQEVHPLAQDLIKRMLVIDPKERMGFS